MVSWRTHALVGDVLFSFHDNRIDRLIDNSLAHDLSRIDIGKLVEVVNKIKSWYPNDERALYYFILHHYLDRLVDMLASEFAFYYDSQQPIEEIYAQLRSTLLDRLYHDPKNVISLTIHDLDTLYGYLAVYYPTRRSDKRVFKWMEILRRAYEGIRAYNLTWLKRYAECVFLKIKEDFGLVLYYVLRDESTLRKVLQSARMRIISKIYRSEVYGIGVANREEEVGRLTNFLNGLIRMAEKYCESRR